MSSLTEPKPVEVETSPVADEDQLVRQRAIAQIQRRRRFWVSTVVWGLILVGVVAIWATTEYHNAAGWPTDGFGQSSGIPHVWNDWIIYPVVLYVLLTAAHAWTVFWHKPISEEEIRREIERQTGARP